MEEKTVFLVFEKYDGLIALGSSYEEAIENIYDNGYLYSNFAITKYLTMEKLNLSKEAIKKWDMDIFNDVFSDTKETTFYMREEKYF